MLGNFTQQMTVTGTVVSVDPSAAMPTFTLKTRGGDVIKGTIAGDTFFPALKNLDLIDRDRLPPPPPETNLEGLGAKLARYAVPGRLVTVEGVYQVHNNEEWFDVKQFHVLYSHKNMLLFEHTHWWVTQITAMGDKWLDDLFGDRRSYMLDDFVAFYRTQLNIMGLPTDDNVQEMATLSRFIYGLSSAYLMNGDIRFYNAARAGVEFQREAFRSLSADGRFCFWAYGRRRGRYGTKLMLASEISEHWGTISLYEQIYSMAGLAQFYRISADWQVLHDIRRTVEAIEEFFLDKSELGGYFSHIDPVTFSPRSPSLGDNRAQKNWNSIGDHIPAYLVNLVLALDPLPIGREAELAGFRETCLKILDRTAHLIVDRFPDPDKKVPFVNEKFDEQWNPNHNYKENKNRGIVGHNLKIAWNLTRVARHYESAGKPDQARKMMDLADRLGQDMARVGIDLLRSGCWDMVEREPRGGRLVEINWGATKDFWQQEQAVLAYLILHGHTSKPEYLRLARELESFWNLFFLDRDRWGVFFRVTDNGVPIVAGEYGNKAMTPVGGYHSFELNYLAHVYNRTYLHKERREDNVFCMNFKPHANSGQRSINVLPDFAAPGDLEVVGVVVNGVRRTNVDPNKFQIDLSESELGTDVIVELCPTKERNEKNRKGTPA